METNRKFDFAKLNNAKLKEGFWWHRTENYMEIIESQLEALLCKDNSAKLINFAIAAGLSDEDFFGVHWSDGDCYKFLEACCYVYQNTGDEKVLEIINKYSAWVAKAQEEDGYIGTHVTSRPDRKRWENIERHELYNMGHFFTFAVAHKNATGSDMLIKCGLKMVDYLYSVFSSYPEELGHFGFNPSQIMGLSDFYRATNYQKAVELAEIFVNMRGSIEGGSDENQDRIPLREETMAVGHAVTSTYLYAGAVDVYAGTGEKELFDAVERIWEDLTSKRIYITGGVCPVFFGHAESGDETYESHGVQYELPNKIAYNESCANIGFAMWSLRMLSVTEDTKYGDWAEQVMYNAGISGSNLSLTRYFYSNPLSYRKDTPITQTAKQFSHKSSRRWHTFDCWCCPPQLFRTMAGIGRWVYGVSDKALYVNMFTSCDYVDESTEISMKTNYPWEDTIAIDVVKADNKVLKIRIPAWCKNPTVNGQSVEAGYYVVSVNSGDKIEIRLPMVAMFMQANANVETDRGMVCVKRGPVVYCAEGIDNERILDEIYIDTNSEIKSQFDKDLLDGVVKLQVGAKARKQQKSLYGELIKEEQETILNLIPYYTWANREESDMSIWFPQA